MKAITFQDLQKVAYETVPDPQIIEPTDAIVKVILTAVCGSDLHVYHGRETGCDCGTVMGHEFVGEVVEVGNAVKTIKIGDKVVSPFSTNCGQCYFCKIGLTARCTEGQLYGWRSDGQGLEGGQAEYVRVPLADGTLFNYADIANDKQALLAGDVLSTGFFCADMADIRKSGNYGVVGCGPVGLMAVLGAKYLGAEKVYAIDSIPERLDMAKRFGAIPISLKQNPIEYLEEQTKGIGLDAVMEAVGSSSAGKLAYDLVRPGGIISTVGVHTSPQFSFSPDDAYNKNLTYKIGRCPAGHYMRRLLPLLHKFPADPTSIITHKYALSNGVAAYHNFDTKKDGCLKVVLQP